MLGIKIMINKKVLKYVKQLIDTVDYFYSNWLALLYDAYLFSGNRAQKLEVLLAYALSYNDPRCVYIEKIHKGIVRYLKAQSDEYYEGLMDKHKDPGDEWDVLDIMYSVYPEIDLDIPDDIINFDKKKFIENIRWDYTDDKLWEKIVCAYKDRALPGYPGFHEEYDEIEEIAQKLLTLSIDKREYIERATEEYYNNVDARKFRPDGIYDLLYWERGRMYCIADALYHIGVESYVYEL